MSNPQETISRSVDSGRKMHAPRRANRPALGAEPRTKDARSTVGEHGRNAVEQDKGRGFLHRDAKQPARAAGTDAAEKTSPVSFRA